MCCAQCASYIVPCSNYLLPSVSLKTQREETVIRAEILGPFQQVITRPLSVNSVFALPRI